MGLLRLSMNHPLAFFSDKLRKPLFLAFFTGTVILFAVFRPLGEPLTTPAAPSGIVSFELACTPTNAQTMIDSWDTHARLYAAFGLGFDFLFMPIYALTLSFASLLAAGRHPGWFANLGAWMGYCSFAAAIFDGVENIGLWNSLLGHAESVWPAISFWCATVKFSVILLGILYGLIGWLWPKK